MEPQDHALPILATLAADGSGRMRREGTSWLLAAPFPTKHGGVVCAGEGGGIHHASQPASQPGVRQRRLPPCWQNGSGYELLCTVRA